MTEVACRTCPRCQTVAALRANGYCQNCRAALLREWRLKHPERYKANGRAASDRARTRNRLDIAKKWANALRDPKGECLFCSQIDHADDCPANTFLQHLDDMISLWER